MRFLSAFILLGLLSLPACGVKGDLQPKGKPEPQSVTGLNARQQGETVLLNWNQPAKNQDGSELVDLAGFSVGLYSYAPENFCQECRDQETLATIDARDPYPAIVSGQTYYLRSAKISTGRGFRYRVVPFSDSGKNGPAADIRLTVRAAPAAPLDIRSEQLDRGVKLFWSLPEGIQQAGELLGVNIYRGISDDGLAPEPINQAPVKGNNFDNYGLINGTTYQYGIRTAVRVGGSVIESELSELIQATPQAGL